MKRILLSLIVILATAFLPKADDFTFIVADGDLPYTTQTWFYSGHGNDLDEAKIKKYWDEGYRITSAAYTGRGWFVVMSKGSGIGAQSYWFKNPWPADWLKEKWENGYQMTQCSVGNGKWLVVMSKGTGITGQVANFESPASLKPWIKERWNDGYRITITAPKDDKWYVVMSKSSGLSGQTYNFFDSYTSAKNFISEKWKEEYYLTQMTENSAGQYFCVMSGKNKSTKESYYPLSDNPTEWIRKQWNEGKDISHVCGGYEKKQSTNSGNYAASTTKRSTTTTTQQQRNQPTKYREDLGAGMFAIVIKYSDNMYMKSLYAPCSICHATTKCGNCYGYGRCKDCRGTGNMYYNLGDYYPCVLCGGTGVCAICKGSGVCPCASGEYPGYLLSNVMSVTPDGVFSTAEPRGRIDGSSRTNGQTYSRSGCPKCGGTGIDPKPNDGTYYGYASFLGYSNSAGSKCPHCGSYTSHYHEKCTGCNVPTY